MKQNGVFADPELKEDRFDFKEEPFSDEDIEKSSEGDWEEQPLRDQRDRNM